MFQRVINFFTSMRLTVACLGLGLILIFVGTLAQVDQGLYGAQNRFFRSLLIYWSPSTGVKIPVFPGGYLVGTVLLINLLAAHAKRFTLSKKKIGIFITHAGLILLLAGQLATDLLSKESHMQLTEGEMKNYSEDFKENELVIIDTSDAQADHVYSIPEALLAKEPGFGGAKLPVTVMVKNYWPNADLFDEPPIKENIPKGALKTAANKGALHELMVLPQPKITVSEGRDLPAAVIEVSDSKSTLGTFLVYAGTNVRQKFKADGVTYEISLRFKRYYHPFSLTLLKATHEIYKGTDIPKNFASRVRIDNPAKGEARETVIYMNNPLRYSGLTFFQFQMAAGEMAEKAGQRPTSTLQVVRNPGWLTPYLACVMVAAGLIIQFMSHLIGFAMKRRTA